MRFESKCQNEKKWNNLQFEKMYYLYNFFLAGLLTLHFQDDL